MNEEDDVIEISWGVLVPVAVVTIPIQALGGVVFVRWVWPWTEGRKMTEWLLMLAFATTPLVVMAALFALIARQPADVILAGAFALMCAGLLPFLLAGLPVLDWMLAALRRLREEVET